MYSLKEHILTLPETQPGKVFPHQRASSCRLPAGPLLRSAQQAAGSPHHLQRTQHITVIILIYYSKLQQSKYLSIFV